MYNKAVILYILLLIYASLPRDTSARCCKNSLKPYHRCIGKDFINCDCLNCKNECCDCKCITKRKSGHDLVAKAHRSKGISWKNLVILF